MTETPAYRAHLEENQIEDQTRQKIFAPLKELFKSHKLNFLRAIGILTLMSSLVVSVVFWVNYIPTAYGFERADVYFATTLSMVWSALSVPLMGFLSDRIGRKRAILIFTGLFMLSIRPMINMLHAEDVQSLILFFVIYQTFISGLFANYFALLSEIFPTRIRFTAIALCYNLVTTCAAMIPSYLTYQQTVTPGPQTIVQFYLIVAVVTAIGALSLRDQSAPQNKLENYAA